MGDKCRGISMPLLPPNTQPVYKSIVVGLFLVVSIFLKVVDMLLFISRLLILKSPLLVILVLPAKN